MLDDAPPNPALLPAGLRDSLPPEAETNAASVAALMAAFAGHGYQRVQPPLLEFEDGLLAGAGAAMADQTFRLMDPDTRRMMGLRADMTPQLARIAATRLRDMPRPLRLSYSGQCLRVRGSQMAPERQVAQAGIELIGPDCAEADAEMLLVAAEALLAVGLGADRVCFDLGLPRLAPLLLEAAPEAARPALAHALDRKDRAEVARFAGAADAGLAETLIALLDAAGPAASAVDALARCALPPGARALAERLAEMVALLAARAPELRLVADPLECRAFRYHSGVTFTIYAVAQRTELGRGGRYLGGIWGESRGESEPATGLTLFPEAVLRAAPRRDAMPRLFVPPGAHEAAGAWRARGYATIAALPPVPDPMAEARRLGCTHLLRGGDAIPT